ncbi:putative ATP-binding protein [Serinicoccus hydrothermalis]|uniref:Putative ATP-binding protein n=1 Tax=Serinicoccus hydrothermalis TaxID=1758689 RepID=A0A1B1NGD9_9MICO|nr:ATP-binding protein [Serinicoccus hydrothermalis]ANS80507.1 putative ATP-binding protein [Serinicoccus hydrothermalis]
MDPAPPPARVLVLAGPSGAGKSRLSSRLHTTHGWPVVQLDDFYREGTDTGLPMSPLGLPDWDHVDSWDCDAALDALEQLCREGSAQMPVYDISRSAVSGTHEVCLDGHTVVVAEGIFAANVVAGLRERGLLAGAWCIRNRPWVTFARRLARDLAQRRKPPLTLWRRGHVLRRAEPGIVAAQEALGAAPMTAREAEARAGGLSQQPVTQPRDTERGAGG